MTQCQTIVKAMLENRDKEVWTASDFQKGKYFVGYEATARISDLFRIFPGCFIRGEKGRFRTISLNKDSKEAIEKLENYVKEEEDKDNEH